MSLAKTMDILFGWLRVSGSVNESDVKKMLRRTASVAVGAATTTSAQGTATLFHVFNNTNQIKSAYFELGGTTLAASSTNYIDFQLHRKTTQTAATSLVGYLKSSTAAITNNYAMEMTLVATNVAGSKGEGLVYQVTRSDVTTGVAASAGVLTLEYEEID